MPLVKRFLVSVTASFVQCIYDGAGELMNRIEPEGRRVKLRPRCSLTVLSPGPL